MKIRHWLPIELVELEAGDLPMPEQFYRAEHVNGCGNDALFIHEQLLQLTINQRSRAAVAYSDAYSSGVSRAECNTRLRRFVERCARTNQGQVFMPEGVA